MRIFPLVLATCLWSGIAFGQTLREPSLKLPPSGGLRVALTLDACSGGTDYRILDRLVSERIPATIFVTARWLKRNGAALAILKANPDLFEIEDHGLNHTPAIDVPMRVYGIPAAGSMPFVVSEVDGGAVAVSKAAAPPKWFRGATAKYTDAAIAEIHRLGLRVAGYSLNGDEGSTLGARAAERRIAAAKDGDVIIAHLNQPKHAAGEGVANGIVALKARGAEFVRLETLTDDGLGGAGY